MTSRALYLLVVLSVPAALFVQGCGDTTTPSIDSAATADLSVADGPAVLLDFATVDLTSNIPARPRLGAQMDRVGRPAINTALTDPFNFDNMHDVVQDLYNSDSNPATWAATWAPKMGPNLAIYDLLDGTCGNQALYDPATGTNKFLDAGYTRLAALLADDELFLNTASVTCTSYLAVESAFLRAQQPMDCGGRAPAYDVIDATYNFLGGGAMLLTDGIAMDNDNGPTMTFPFFGAPN